MNDGATDGGGEQPAPKGPLPEEKPQRVKPRIIAAPKIRQLYWCDFWRDSQLPEMWKTRPVVVVSYKNALHGPCLVVPTSTDPQDDNRWAYKLSSSVDGQTSWAVCNQPSTIAPSRLSQVRGKIPLVSEADFNEILARLMAWLPKPFDLEK
jgi:mRNA interferase MazF